MARLREHEHLLKETDAFLAKYGRPPDDAVRTEVARVLAATREAIGTARIEALQLMPHRPGVQPWKTSGLALVLKPGFGARKRDG